jgi:hypothetical protein
MGEELQALCPFVICNKFVVHGDIQHDKLCSRFIMPRSSWIRINVGYSIFLSNTDLGTG